MYLSKIEILGFKSFAQKISLAFDAGITAIVGPNGCGKTNVVDAIRWALGEQRPTTLRSDKMEDVIFNGTKSRKPLGMAEVSLTIENTKGILPTEFSEVTITRRVYRSGESEYYLNKTLCRLKDIRDLFMDTGMGSDAYSVIELKMVETILSDKADERRRLFEEAAGVTKYKHRRRETYRRLESVQLDLTRVNDIVREVQKAVNSLERQAHKAQRYNEYAKQLHEKEVDLLKREYANVSTKITPLQLQLNFAVDEKTRIDVELQQEEALLEVLRTEMQELENRIAEAQTALSRQQEIVSQYERAIATGQERRKSLTTNIDRAEKEKVEIIAQREHLEKKLSELRKSLETTRISAAEAEEAYLRKKQQHDEFAVQVEATKGELKTHRDRVISLLHEVSEIRQREGQVKAKTDNLRGRKEFIAEENGTLRAEIEKNTELVTRLSAEDRELRRKFAAAEVRVHELEDTRVRLQQEIEQLKERDFELRSVLERTQARMDFLKGLVESYDGVSEGARYLIKSEQWRSRIRTTVGEALTVDSKHRLALEAALGETVGYVLVDSVSTAYDAIEFLKKQEKGKATFVCLDRVPQNSRSRPDVGGDGVVGWAADIAEADGRLKPLYEFLLDGTLVVKDVRSAMNVVRQYPALRCVTLDGEILTGSGVVRGGSVRQDEGGYIGRRSQLEELAAEIRKLEAQRAKLQKEHEQKTDELGRIDIKREQDEAKDIEQKTTDVEIRIAQLEFEKKRAGESLARNHSEGEKLDKEIDLLAGELSRIVPTLRELDERKSEAERQSGAAARELETMEAMLAEHSKGVNDANVLVLSLKSELRSIEQENQHTTTTIESLSAAFAQRSVDIESARQEIGQIAAQIDENSAALKDARKHTEVMKEQKKEIEGDYSQKRSHVHDIEMKLKDERLKHEGSLKATHDLEFKIQELSMKAENFKNRAKEEFDVEMTLESFPDNETFDFTAAREEIRLLKEKLRTLGPVNFAAFDEYKSEKERLDFVNAQKGDLEESEKTLIATIDEINTTAQRKFLDTFAKIRENFITTFKGLFDEGDECDLRLEEGVDPLEARIEITAKPRGKRPTSIDLLSGGEKTLTAIALLFAIYLVKPSPFCILDEVDAPLDDSNIDRFTRILRKFSDNTQFIVVTHNKRTMEAANALYGVTMEEEGVSKLVSVRFEQPVTS